MQSQHYSATFDWNIDKNDPQDTVFADLCRQVPLVDLPSQSVVLQGIPFDAAIRGRPGAKEAPPVIRRFFALLKAHSLESGPIDLRIHDIGDLVMETTDVFAAHERVEQAQNHLLEKGSLPISLGGDHSLTYPLCKPLVDRGKTAVVNLDAHLDIREVRGQPCSGSSFSRLMQAGMDRCIVIGVREFTNSTHFLEKTRRKDHPFKIISSTEVSRRNLNSIVSQVLEFCQESDHIYLTIDMDAADQSKAPGVSAPTTSGLSIREMMVIARALAGNPKVKAVDLMEVSPPLDHNDLTSRAAAAILASVIAGLQDRRDYEGDTPLRGMARL